MNSGEEHREQRGGLNEANRGLNEANRGLNVAVKLKKKGNRLEEVAIFDSMREADGLEGMETCYQK